MQMGVDPSGRNGLSVKNSGGALLQFYSNQKNLAWFDQSQPAYIQWSRQKGGLKGGRKAIRIVYRS